MRVTVQGPAGALARDPEAALSALADIAEADGAVRVEWLEKAVRSAGATQIAVPVVRAPRYQVVDDSATNAVRVYNLAMMLAQQAIKQRLEQAVRDADIERYKSLLPSRE